jgi:hypothetical protein
VLHAQATHFSQGFKAYLSVKIRGDVFANPLERGLHAHAEKVVHQRFSFPSALGKHAKLRSATASATGLHLTEEVWLGFSNLAKGGNHEDAFSSRLVLHSKSSSRVDCFSSGPIRPLAGAVDRLGSHSGSLFSKKEQLWSQQHNRSTKEN